MKLTGSKKFVQQYRDNSEPAPMHTAIPAAQNINTIEHTQGYSVFVDLDDEVLSKHGRHVGVEENEAEETEQQIVGSPP